MQGTAGRGGAGQVEGTARLSSAKAGDMAKTKVTLRVRRLRLHDRVPQAGGFRSGSSFLPAVEAGCRGRGAGQGLVGALLYLWVAAFLPYGHGRGRSLKFWPLLVFF